MQHVIRAVLRQSQQGTRAVLHSDTYNQLLPELSKHKFEQAGDGLLIEGVRFERGSDDVVPGFVSLVNEQGEVFQILPVDIPTSSANV